jgi:hypothetical protein
MKIYKYLSPNTFDLVFAESEKAKFKCSYPKDYNDPYELFLAINPNDMEPELLATYNEIIGDIPQYPTSCFSTSPDIIPMWAHYAVNSTGFVVEIDEESLREEKSEITIDNVHYKNGGSGIDIDLLRRACFIGKPRYAYLLARQAFSTAYFTKNACWSYESERRVILGEDEIERRGEIMTIPISVNCVSSIIIGPASDKIFAEKCLELCEYIDCNCFEMKIGRSSLTPYFLDTSNDTFLFNGESISDADCYCEDCGEPIDRGDIYKCAWCSLTDDLKEDATSKNPMRALARSGLLEGYVKTMNSVDTIKK